MYDKSKEGDKGYFISNQGRSCYCFPRPLAKVISRRMFQLDAPRSDRVHWINTSQVKSLVPGGGFVRPITFLIGYMIVVLYLTDKYQPAKRRPSQ